MIRTPVILIGLLVAALGGSDPYCPIYPQPQRQVLQSRLALERSVQAMRVVERRLIFSGPADAPGLAGGNIIDNRIFSRMVTDGVVPADLTTDTEFLRRLSLDLTGRIPSIEKVESFVQSTDPTKRTKLIDELISSEAFVDYWTAYFARHFEVTSEYYYFIGIPGRNLFYNYLRDFVRRDRSYAEVASEMIASSGDSYTNAPVNFLVRGVQQGDPVQDTWDVLTDRITTKFLGVKTECVSCHDGANHLEEINLYLAERKRKEFWGLSAFLSRMNLIQLSADAFNEQSFFVVNDRPNGLYNGAVDPNNPGPRPPRDGASATPTYIFSGEEPRNDNWRSEFARMVVSDRQFARATVNYLWAHFFRAGIVDPPGGWDLARIDPNTRLRRPGRFSLHIRY